jgi:hypothetical protein
MWLPIKQKLAFDPRRMHNDIKEIQTYIGILICTVRQYITENRFQKTITGNTSIYMMIHYGQMSLSLLLPVLNGSLWELSPVLIYFVFVWNITDMLRKWEEPH